MLKWDALVCVDLCTSAKEPTNDMSSVNTPDPPPQSESENSRHAASSFILEHLQFTSHAHPIQVCTPFAISRPTQSGTELFQRNEELPVLDSEECQNSDIAC